MKKTNTLLIFSISLFSVLIILLSIYMKDTAEFRLSAKAERVELLRLNQEQLRLLELQNERSKTNNR